ncbi:MAG TPA: VWA domain-containing protein, partial [Gemmatimonadaceae bacterium]
MEDKLVEFANLLRQNGVRVSLAETLDAVAASGMIGLNERDAFRGALRATMIKRANELPVFEELFDVYFSGLGEIIKQAGQGVQDALSMSDQEFQKFLDQVEEMLKQQGDKLSELARELLQNRSGQLEKRLREAARAVRLQGVERTIEENYFARALARALGLDKLEQEIRELRDQIQKLEFGSELKAQLEKYLDRRLKALEDIIRRYVRMEREKRDLRAREEQRLNQLSDKSFYYLSDEELDRMKEAVTRLAQRLKNVLAVRRKHAKKGRFDIKRTLRHNLENGGVPFKLRFEKRRREKPQVVILCDVSDSVRNASRFMLQFVYSLQDLYSRVRSFVFVSDIGEVTEHFRSNDIKEALDVALKGDIINVYAHSNFGYAFRNFVTDHLGSVNKRTTVIV